MYNNLEELIKNLNTSAKFLERANLTLQDLSSVAAIITINKN